MRVWSILLIIPVSKMVYSSIVEGRRMLDTDNANLIKVELLYCEMKKTQKINDESLDCMFNRNMKHARKKWPSRLCIWFKMQIASVPIEFCVLSSRFQGLQAPFTTLSKKRDFSWLCTKRILERRVCKAVVIIVESVVKLTAWNTH